MLSPFWDLYPIIENTGFLPLIRSFINAVGLSFAFTQDFDAFGKSPSQWWTCNLYFFASGSFRYCRTTRLLGRSQDVYHISSCRSMGGHSVASAELSFPSPPSMCLLSISIHKFRLLMSLSTHESMAIATSFQATGTACCCGRGLELSQETTVSPRPSCHCYKPWVTQGAAALSVQ